MATTKIWAVTDRLDQVVNYIENEEKTIGKALNYVSRNEATENKKYVYCLNCNSNNPVASMMNTKKLFNDQKKRIAFHGTQSFKTGEVDADTAHEIGIQLINELFGNRYEVVLTTHLDKDHIHNHFLINSTSFVDGKHYTNSKTDYKRMKEVSDSICKEYGLSVIENPKVNNSKYESYHKQSSYIKEIKRDMDDCRSRAITFSNFIDFMRFEGYEFKTIDEMDYIIHPNYSKPIPFNKLGNRYSVESINESILENEYPRNRYSNDSEIMTLYRKYKNYELTGFQRAYVKWMVVLGILPDKRIKKNYTSPETRKEQKKLDIIMKEVMLMSKYNINTIEDLNVCRNEWQKEFDVLKDKRKQLQNKAANCKDETEKHRLYEEAKSYSSRIKELRYQLNYLKDIEDRSLRLEEQGNKIEEKQKKKDRGAR